jgi:opacity protein-like surface antigen
MAGGYSSARAADMPVTPPYKAPPVIYAYNWTGFYVGAHGGYSWGRGSINLSDNRGIDRGLFPATIGSNPSGFLGGVQTGYNYQADRWVFGLETDIAWAGIARSQERAFFTGDIPHPGVINLFDQTVITSGENRLDAFGTWCRPDCGWNLRGAISGNLKLSDQAARSIG